MCVCGYMYVIACDFLYTRCFITGNLIKENKKKWFLRTTVEQRSSNVHCSLTTMCNPNTVYRVDFGCAKGAAEQRRSKT
jgi:hypothetical protein